MLASRSDARPPEGEEASYMGLLGPRGDGLRGGGPRLRRIGLRLRRSFKVPDRGPPSSSPSGCLLEVHVVDPKRSLWARCATLWALLGALFEFALGTLGLLGGLRLGLNPKVKGGGESQALASRSDAQAHRQAKFASERAISGSLRELPGRGY